MLTIEEIKAAIELLPHAEIARLRHWLQERDCDKWDQQINADSAAGRLAFLIAEAIDEKANGA